MSAAPASQPGSKGADADAEWVDDGTRTPIPQPPEKWLLGNLTDVDADNALSSLRNLAKLYGEIYQLRIANNLKVFVSSQRIVHAICNEDKFGKVVSGPLVEVRNFAGDGEYTELFCGCLLQVSSPPSRTSTTGRSRTISSSPRSARSQSRRCRA